MSKAQLVITAVVLEHRSKSDVARRVYKAFVAPPTTVVRSREQQLPDPKDVVGTKRERLYVSSTPRREMAGLLIYTAAGDSEGTMGVSSAWRGQTIWCRSSVGSDRCSLVLHRPGVYGCGREEAGTRLLQPRGLSRVRTDTVDEL
jgi:hypothetical protein